VQDKKINLIDNTHTEGSVLAMRVWVQPPLDIERLKARNEQELHKIIFGCLHIFNFNPLTARGILEDFGIPIMLVKQVTTKFEEILNNFAPLPAGGVHLVRSQQDGWQYKGDQGGLEISGYNAEGGAKVIKGLVDGTLTLLNT
jgi:hypothetical protein